MTLDVAIQKRLSPGFLLDVSFSAPPGITIVFGASGSGKTTLLRCLAGLTRPDAGRIACGSQVLFESAARRDVRAERRNVGYVFQHLALFPHMSVARNLEYGLAGVAGDLRQARIRAIAASFRIAHLLDRKPGAISGGERQRTALARSLVTDPSLLLLDEPLSALDHVTQTRIIEDLRSWNAAHGIPILYVTHAHREVFALGERVLVLDHGRVAAEGTPYEVLETPGHEPLAQLAGFENFFDGRVTARRTAAGTMQCRLEPGDTELEVPLSDAPPGSPIRIAIRAGDILLAIEEPRGLSARNVLPGRLASLTREGTTSVAEVDAGARFVVRLTPSACESLGLAPGNRVWLIIKTHSCRIVSTTLRNQASCRPPVLPDAGGPEGPH
jgi:molybdate transport system ATP-binding protein